MIARGTRFGIPFDTAFPNGLLQVGDVEPDNEYQPDKTKPARQNRDELTGKLQWKVTVTDPGQTNAKRASFVLIFLADVQPVPSTAELAPGTGLRMIELENLTAEPKVQGQGEYKYLGYAFRAEGYREAPAKQSARSGAESGKAA